MRPRAREPGVEGRAIGAAGAQLLLHALEDEDVRVDGHTDRKHEGCDPGEVERDGDQLEHRHRQDRVNEQRHGGEEARHAVVEDHEQRHQQQPDLTGQHRALHRVLAERRVDLLLLQHRELHRQGARVELHDELARPRAAVDRGEGHPVDDAPIEDHRSYDVRGQQFVVEEDRELLAHQTRGDLLRQDGALVGPLELDHGVAERVGADERVGAQEAPGERRRLAVEHALGLHPLAGRVTRRPAAEVAARLAELEQGGAAEEIPRLVGVESRELDRDVGRALACHLGLGDAGGVDAAAQHAQRALDRVVDVALGLLGEGGLQQQARPALQVEAEPDRLALEVADGHAASRGPRHAGR